jgi:hypothetical protein
MLVYLKNFLLEICEKMGTADFLDSALDSAVEIVVVILQNLQALYTSIGFRWHHEHKRRRHCWVPDIHPF